MTEISVVEALYGNTDVTDVITYFARAGKAVEVTPKWLGADKEEGSLTLRLNNGEVHVAQAGEKVEFFPMDPSAAPEVLLTIAVCSVPERLARFSTVQDLSAQAQGLPHVEVVYLGDNRRMTIGRKRNLLVQMALGTYFCFVDDDDRVEATFVRDILYALYRDRDDTDCFTYQVSVEWPNCQKICYYSQHFVERNEPDRFLRLPNHLMVWKRAKMVSFPPASYAEDFNFAREMRAVGYTETAIPKVLYHYDITEDSVSGPVFLSSLSKNM